MTKAIWLGAATLIALQGQAFGQTPIGSVGPWSIVDTAKACSMQARTQDQTSIAFIMQKGNPDSAQLRLANPNWQSLAQQQKVKIDVLIDGRGQLLRPVPTFSTASESGVVIPFGNGYMRQVFTQGATIAVFYRSRELLILYLSDATKQAAFQEVRECVGDRYDPFAAR